MNPFTKYIGEIVYNTGEYQEMVIGVHRNKCLVMCYEIKSHLSHEFKLYRLEVMDSNQNMISNHAYYDTDSAFTALLAQ